MNILKPTVHILATVRKPELLPAALLVFRTLRTGFPDAPVCVWGNGLEPWAAEAVAYTAAGRGCEFRNLPKTSHDEWIETLLQAANEPFWICDTDMVLFGEMKAPKATLFAGRYEPEFVEEWTGTRHMERLHTCLMWLNPVPLRCAIREYMGKIPAPWGNTAQFTLVRQTFVPLTKRQTLFYDTCAGLYHALGGTRFTPAQDAAFEHLYCGTYADLVTAPSLKDLRAVHAQVYANPQAARGLKAQLDDYFARHKPKGKL